MADSLNIKMIDNLAKDNNKVAWLRVLLSSVFLSVLFLSAMALMLFYRLSFLPLAIEHFCPDVNQNVYCVSNITHQLVYANQWLSIQFVVYFLLSFVLLPLFIKAQGNPLLNLLSVGVLSTLVINFLTSNVGIELYASFFCPVFIGLLIKSRRNKNIKINRNINRLKV